LNTTTYAGFTTSTHPAGISSGFPLRDASDYVQMVKRRALYRENNSGGPFTGQSSPYYPTVQSNVTRLTYQFGRVNCASCNDGPFPNANLGS